MNKAAIPMNARDAAVLSRDYTGNFGLNVLDDPAATIAAEGLLARDPSVLLSRPSENDTHHEPPGEISQKSLGKENSAPSAPAGSEDAAGSELFVLETVPDRDCAHVVPSGDLDLSTAGRLEASALQLLESGFGHLVLDLRRVTFIDSQGLLTLLVIHARACELAARLEVLSGPGQVTRLLHFTGLDALLDVATRSRNTLLLQGQAGARLARAPRLAAVVNR